MGVIASSLVYGKNQRLERDAQSNTQTKAEKKDKAHKRNKAKKEKKAQQRHKKRYLKRKKKINENFKKRKAKVKSRFIKQKAKIKKKYKNRKKRKEMIRKKRSALHSMMTKLRDEKNRKSFENAKKHWFHKHPKPVDKNDTTPIDIFSTFGLGYGGPSAYQFSNMDDTDSIWMSTVDLALDKNLTENPYYQKIKNFQPEQFNLIQKHLANTKYLIYWLPKGWDESWFSVDQIQLAMNQGLTPIFMYWYFGDKLVNGIPSDEEITAYYEDNQRVTAFMAKLKGQKIVIMEPEFNKQAILETNETQDAFSEMINTAISTIKADTDKELLFSLCMTDTGRRSSNNVDINCGYDNCALGDQNAWSQAKPVYDKVINNLDFISFQQMLGQFSRDPHNPGTLETPIPKAYSEDDLSTELLAQRINNFTKFLHNSYEKPVLMPYMALATATWTDDNDNKSIDDDELDLSGWEYKVEQVYKDLYDMRDMLQENGLFGYAPLSLFDNPSQDKGGYQYFLNNEYHFGIMKTGAVDDIDSAIDGNLIPKGTVLDSIYNID